MKEDFIIRIKSRSEQFEHTQPVRVDEDDRIELMTYGSFVVFLFSFFLKSFIG